MGISYNCDDISAVNYNNGVLSSVLYNGIEVWPNAELVDYVFPNENFKMTSDKTEAGSGYIQAYYDARNYAYTSSFKAFDDDLSTAYVGKYTSAQDNGRITIAFPFDIYIQSITIKNASINPCSSSANIGGLKKGYIYTHPDTVTGNFTPTSKDGTLTYAMLERDNASTAGYATTHTNPEYSDTAIRSICICGSGWGSDGAQSWHVIGEVSLAFKAKSKDLKQYGLL